MSRNDDSRRGFIQRTAVAAANLASQLPRCAWTILGVNWEYNDEFNYEAGEFLEPRVYFNEQEAIAACEKLCAEFFAESPQEFEPCWIAYEVDRDTATWEDLRQGGFPDPYSVKELKT